MGGAGISGNEPFGIGGAGNGGIDALEIGGRAGPGMPLGVAVNAEGKLSSIRAVGRVGGGGIAPSVSWGGAGTPIFILASSSETGMFGGGSSGRGVPTATLVALAGSSFAIGVVGAGLGIAIGAGEGTEAHPVNPKPTKMQIPANRCPCVIDSLPKSACDSPNRAER